MMAAFHYLVKVNLYRDQDSKNIDYNDINNIDFIKDERRYEDENPIKAREAAFKFYEEYIEDLLANLKQEVGDDKQIRIISITKVIGKSSILNGRLIKF